METHVAGTQATFRDDGGDDGLLINGGPVHIAPSQLADLERVRLFYDHLSDTSNYYRFFGIRRAIPERELREAVDPQVDRHVTLMATIDGELVGIGEFVLGVTGDEAEVAFAVSDDHRGEGIATLLLEHLVTIARRRGIKALTAMVLPGNEQMLLVFRTIGLPETAVFGEKGVVDVRFDLSAPDELDQRSAERHLNAMNHALSKTAGV